MNNLRNCIVLLILLLAIPVAAFDQIENFSPVDRDRIVTEKVELNNSKTAVLSSADPYWDGNIKVYVVEEVSSMGWTSGGHLYEFPFLAFAINSSLVLNDTVWDTTVTWDGYDFGYNDLREDNIAVQAVITSKIDGFHEAAAMAYPGIPGSNILEDGSTHTVFVEEGTATW
jgi:hypothetical protein